MEQDINALKRQILQLTELHQAGALTAEQFDQSKAALERRLLDAVLSDAAATPASAPKDKPAKAAAQPKPTPAAAAAEPKPRPSALLVSGMAVLVLALATTGYLWTRTPEPVGGVAAQGADAHASDAQKIDAMIERLATRLKDNPNDAAGWGMLARSYGVLGRHAEAVEAYAKALALSKDDAGLMVDYADALAVKNNRTLEGEPMKLVERALKIDPRNIKGLALAGTYAFDHKDYKTAVKHWTQVVEFGGPDNLFAQQIQPGLDEARNLAGMGPATPKAAPTSLAEIAKSGGVAQPAAASGASVSGKVTLAKALASKVEPNDTVFITARPAEGSRMPLAVIRKQVKDLPISFTLDDSLAMSPAARISGATQVIVTARVSKSGNAIAQPGDLAVQSAPVKVGTSGLALEIQ